MAALSRLPEHREDYRAPITGSILGPLSAIAFATAAVASVALGALPSMSLVGAGFLGAAVGWMGMALTHRGTVRIQRSDSFTSSTLLKMIQIVVWTSLSLTIATLIGVIPYALFVGGVTLPLIGKMILGTLAVGLLINTPSFVLNTRIAARFTQADAAARAHFEALQAREEAERAQAGVLLQELSTRCLQEDVKTLLMQIELDAAQRWVVLFDELPPPKELPVLKKMEELFAARKANNTLAQVHAKEAGRYTYLILNSLRGDCQRVNEEFDRSRPIAEEFATILRTDALVKDLVQHLPNPPQESSAETIPLPAEFEQLFNIELPAAIGLSIAQMQLNQTTQIFEQIVALRQVIWNAKYNALRGYSINKVELDGSLRGLRSLIADLNRTRNSNSSGV